MISSKRQASLGKGVKLWVVAIVLYTVLRDIVAWQTLSGYGLNVVILMLIDVTTAIPYALASASLFSLLKARAFTEKTLLYLLVTLATFFAPWVYIFIVTISEGVPGYVQLAVAAIFMLLAAKLTRDILKNID